MTDDNRRLISWFRAQERIPVSARMTINKVSQDDRGDLIAANLASIGLHEPWVYPCRDDSTFLAYLSRCDGDRCEGFVARKWDTGQIIGVINLNEIVRGSFQNAYLGYYGIAGFEGRGLMTEAVGLVLNSAFGYLGLHRIEANIQPENIRSSALVQRLGFRREGSSRDYLQIGGVWRDHDRWAILRDEWPNDEKA
jgi:ribosomal-protein-alanine N-acetyltransferase